MQENKLNIVFVGSSNFGLKCLQACLELPQIEITGVVTAPRIFPISYRPSGVTNVLHADLAEFAQTNAIPVLTMQRKMDEAGLLDLVKQWQPQAFLVAGWYHMIPKKWRDLAPAYGLYASLLPDYSGGAPLVWAMINGETKTGITLFQMDDGVDSGPIAGQKEEPIYADDTIASLYSRIEQNGLALVKEILPSMASGELQLERQDEGQRRIMRQRAPEDGLIDWNQEAQCIDRFVRAQTRPYPGAFSKLNGKQMHIWSAKVVQGGFHLELGQVLFHEDSYKVGCRKDMLQLEEISFGKKTFERSRIAELLRGGDRGWETQRIT